MTTIGIPTRSQDDWDRPDAELEAEVRPTWTKPTKERLAWLSSHCKPAAAGELAEYRHLLHDVDPDSVIPALNDQTPGGAS